jgi:glycerophosphoryl diester phosphodiesterase
MSAPHLHINPPIIAHRGASLYAPENTIAAFRKAKALGMNWVEFDVMLTSDHEVVVIHDDLLDRTTSGKGHVYDFPYEYIKTLDAGSWFNPKFHAERVSTLKDIMTVLNELNLFANIEIKAQLGQEELIVTKVLELIKNHLISPPLISSFSYPILECVRKKSPGSWVGMLMHKWKDDWEMKADQLQCQAVDVNYEILTPERVSAIKQTGRTLLAYTVNDAAIFQKLLSWGVDAVFSDCPEKMLKVVNGK